MTLSVSCCASAANSVSRPCLSVWLTLLASSSPACFPPRRTNPGSTPTQGGRTPDRPPARKGRRWRRSSPPKADEPRIDPHPRRTNPGSTASEEGKTMAPQFPTQGGRTPDRPPPKADEPRIDPHPRRTNPGSTPTQGGRTPDRPPARKGRRWRRSSPPKADEPRLYSMVGVVAGRRPASPL